MITYPVCAEDFCGSSGGGSQKYFDYGEFLHFCVAKKQTKKVFGEHQKTMMQKKLKTRLNIIVKCKKVAEISVATWKNTNLLNNNTLKKQVYLT